MTTSVSLGTSGKNASMTAIAKIDEVAPPFAGDPLRELVEVEPVEHARILAEPPVSDTASTDAGRTSRGSTCLERTEALNKAAARMALWSDRHSIVTLDPFDKIGV